MPGGFLVCFLFVFNLGWGRCARIDRRKEVGARDQGRVACRWICPPDLRAVSLSPDSAHPIEECALLGQGVCLTWLLGRKKRRVLHVIGQVGSLGLGAGAGGSKLERFFVTSPTPGNPRLCPTKPK